MSISMQTQKALGLNDHSKVFKEVWKDHNIPTLQKDYGEITTTRQSSFADEEVRENFKGFAAKHIGKSLEKARNGEMMSKAAVDEGAISNVTPLVYDPDFLRILREEAPLTERVPQEGQDGFSANYSRIDARDPAIGFTGETDILDLTDNNRSGIGYSRGQTDMEIWVDLVEVSDFAAAGSDFHFDVRDTTLGERLANASQEKEQAMLYADPSQGATDGSPADGNAYRGFADIISDDAEANNDVDKTSTDISGTDGFVKDLKSEIKAMVQSNKAVNKSDLEIWTSHTAFDVLENEAEVKRRHDTDQNSLDYGFESIKVSGVDIYPSHNITDHSFNGGLYTPGSEGDVFIMNRREMRDRALMPFSTVPLARLGFGEIVALGEFGAPILRGEGHLCKYLKNYQI